MAECRLTTVLDGASDADNAAEHNLPQWDGVFRTSARWWWVGSTVGGGAGSKGSGIRWNTATRALTSRPHPPCPRNSAGSQ
eukprot:5616073-Prymnesium_polylepis.1